MLLIPSCVHTPVISVLIYNAGMHAQRRKPVKNRFVRKKKANPLLLEN